MYIERWNLIKDHLIKPGFVLVDWGSDAGWFSVKIAHAFPTSTVVSIEAGLMSYGEGLRMHEEKLRTYGVENNILVKQLFGPETLTGLSLVPSDYQLVLSIFHHLGDGFGRYLKGMDQWDAAFCDLVRGSSVTFFEIPNENSPGETPHRIRAWYGDRKVEEVIRTALQRGRVDAVVEELGETQHGAKGSRKLFKISLNTPVEAAPAQKITAYIDAAGQQTKIRPYRRLRLFASELLRKVRSTNQVTSKHQSESQAR
jgi:hypothetical protein